MLKQLPCAGTRTSTYVTMRDGVPLAIDVWMPDAPSARSRTEHGYPTIMYQTPYFRSVAWKAPYRSLGFNALLDPNFATRTAFLRAGYVWVDVDVRGSGASGGHRPCPWHSMEIEDGIELVEWILTQPWSNGRVGTMGVSYSGGLSRSGDGWGRS